MVRRQILLSAQEVTNMDCAKSQIESTDYPQGAPLRREYAEMGFESVQNFKSIGGLRTLTVVSRKFRPTSCLLTKRSKRRKETELSP